jgi:lysophospholipase L1-like esterase
VVLGCALTIVLSARSPAGSSVPLELGKGDRVIFLGNTLAERLQLFNHFETLLMTRFPELELIVRNMGWSGDTITLQPRALNFGDADKHLHAQKADVIVAFFGLNESFDGDAGLPQFDKDLDRYLTTLQSQRYNDRTPPRIVLVSPIAHERLARLTEVDVDARNRELSRYTETMRRVAAQRGVTFVDLYTPSKRAMENAGSPLTINGIHVNEAGDRVVAGLLMESLPLAPRPSSVAEGPRLKQLEALREAVRDKNQLFFYRWRPVNAEYYVGRRVDPFGSKSFPPEMQKLDSMIAQRERQIWTKALALQGLRYPDTGTSGGGSRLEPKP